MKKFLKNAFIILSIIIPFAIIIIFVVNDMGSVFDSWGIQSDGTFVKPDGRYILLIIFKLTLYIFPPLIGMVGFLIENKKKIEKHRFLYYFIKALNVHFLVLLIIKLLADSIFELDSVWGLTLFNSIKDVQTLIGYIVTLLIHKNIKVEPGVETQKALTENIIKN